MLFNDFLVISFSGNEDVCLLHVGFHLASSAFVVACLIYTRAHCYTQNLLMFVLLEEHNFVFFKAG